MFYTAYTLLMIFAGQIASLIIRQSRIGSIIGQMFIYIVVLFILLLTSAVTKVTETINETGG